jgi:putative transposase
MLLHQHEYYHLYNRSNNNERVFKQEENYAFFLQRYRHHLHDLVATAAYCLMPTHFHFLVLVKAADTDLVRTKIGVFLSAYAKAINRRFGRHGSLFQEHTKAKHIYNPEYLISAVAYVHQNPVRAGLVQSLEDWKHSSYAAYLRGEDDGFLWKRDVLAQFGSLADFRMFSEAEAVGLPLQDETA